MFGAGFFGRYDPPYNVVVVLLLFLMLLLFFFFFFFFLFETFRGRFVLVFVLVLVFDLPVRGGCLVSTAGALDTPGDISLC
jgi:hypothetical protein